MQSTTIRCTRTPPSSRWPPRSRCQPISRLSALRSPSFTRDQRTPLHFSPTPDRDWDGSDERSPRRSLSSSWSSSFEPMSPPRNLHHRPSPHYAPLQWGGTESTALALRPYQCTALTKGFIPPEDSAHRHGGPGRKEPKSNTTASPFFAFAPFEMKTHGTPGDDDDLSIMSRSSSAAPLTASSVGSVMPLSDPTAATHGSPKEASEGTQDHTTPQDAPQEKGSPASAEETPDRTNASFTVEQLQTALSHEDFVDRYHAFQTLGLSVDGRCLQTDAATTDARAGEPLSDKRSSPPGVFDRDLLKDVFRALVKRLHPDIEGGDVEKMERVNTAYQLLKRSTPLEQASYGYWLAEHRSRAGDTPPTASKQAEENASEGLSGSEVIIGSFYVTMLCLGFWCGAVQTSCGWGIGNGGSSSPPRQGGEAKRKGSSIRSALERAQQSCRQAATALAGRGFCLLSQFGADYVNRVFYHGQVMALNGMHKGTGQPMRLKRKEQQQ